MADTEEQLRVRIKSRRLTGDLTRLGSLNHQNVRIDISRLIREYVDTSTTSDARRIIHIVPKVIGTLRIGELTCRICYGSILPSDSTVQCPHCQMSFHQNHWEGWVDSRHRCPYCRSPV